MSIDKKSLNLFNRVKGAIRRNTKFSRGLKEQVGDMMIGFITNRTIAGFGVVNGKSKQFPDNKQSTIKRRRAHARAGELSDLTSAPESNMIRSGDMIDDLAIKPGKDSVTVFIKSPRNQKKAINNPDRVFMDLTKKEEREIAKFIDAELQKVLRKLK